MTDKYDGKKTAKKATWYASLVAVIMFLTQYGLEYFTTNPPEWAGLTVGAVVIGGIEALRNWLKHKNK